MRLVFVNQAHPDLPHVSGMRLGLFSREMAFRGHQVVLLTCPLPGHEGMVEEPALLAQRLASHNWQQPLILAVPPAIRGPFPSRLPRIVRRGVTMWRFVKESGVHGNWTSAARPWARKLATAFCPDVVWATFGTTSNLALAQAVARATRCPWIIDVKDNWSVFLQPGIRELMAWRFRDAAAFSSNASQHRDIAARWLRQNRSAVIYSGVVDNFFASTATRTLGTRELTLTGSTYDDALLQRFVRAVRDWMVGLPRAQRDELTFVYAGSDCKRVAEVVADIGLPCRLRLSEHLPLDELAARCRDSFANCYLWSKYTFHHKLLELLACGRPVVAFPGETQESLHLARHSQTSFTRCTQSSELVAALASAWQHRHGPAVDNNSQPWRWSDRSVSLEALFATVIAQGAMIPDPK